MNYYEILNIPSSSTKEEISLAHKRLAIKLHPDRHPNKPEIAEKFKQINIAYTTLSDVTKKRDYDEALNQKNIKIQEESTNANKRNFSQNSSNFKDYGNERFSQNFQNNKDKENYSSTNKFSTSTSFGNNKNSRNEIFIDITIGFWEAIRGGTQSIQFSYKGEPFSVTVDLPQCINNGFTIFAETNNLIFQLMLHIDEDSIFTREDNNLYAGLEIPFHIALLGGSIIFPHWRNNKKINIEPGTQGGTEIILRGDGVNDGNKNGDLIIKCNIVFPEKVNLEQKKLIEQFVIIEEAKSNSKYFNKILDSWANMKEYLKSIGLA